MRLFARLLVCCLLFAGCRAAGTPDGAPACPHSEGTAEARPATPTAEDVSESRFARARECAAIHFFGFTEQVASAAGVVVQAALVGLYCVFFPFIGFGLGGPG